MAGKPLKLAILIDSLRMGGAERQLVPYLRHIDRSRFEPVVGALQSRQGNPVEPEIESLGVRVQLIGVPRLLSSSGYRRTIRFLRENSVDVVHSHLQFATILGGLAARRLGIPLVATVHTIDDPVGSARARWRRRLEWWALRRLSRRTIAVAEAVRQHCLGEGGLLPNRVVTIYNGVDPSDFECSSNPQTRCEIRRSFGVPEAAPLIIVVAVLRPAKGVQNLISMLPAILSTVPDAYLLVVGDGEHRGALETMSQKLGVDRRIRFAGMRSDIPRLLGAADLFAYPTLDDALPTVILEAMAARIPVVASAKGGIPEILESGRTGLLVAAGDRAALAAACIDLLVNRGRAQAVAAAAGEVLLERFDVRRQVQRLGALYAEVSGTHGEGGTR